MGPLKRCEWTGTDPLMIEYHDKEWGVPVHDDKVLYEFLVLEGAQAGLSWSTILKRREGYRHAFEAFDIQKVAQFDDKNIERLQQDSGIIRNKLKIKSAIINAQRFIKVQEEFGSFDNYQWGFVDHQPIQNSFKTLSEIPATTELAERFSKDLKKRGFSFVGPTICYAHLQATGVVNDHLTYCFRYQEIMKI
ncbi:MAG: DNA-3-methyladenine glycosylase I [Candidatus Heimdallarchaeota archaeon]